MCVCVKDLGLDEYHHYAAQVRIGRGRKDTRNTVDFKTFQLILIYVSTYNVYIIKSNII